MDLTWNQKNDPGCPDCPHSILMHPMKGNPAAGEPKICAGAMRSKWGGRALAPERCKCTNQRVP